MTSFVSLNTNNANEVLQNAVLCTALANSENALSSLLLNKEINWFTDAVGAIAYTCYKSMNISLGGILAPENHKKILLEHFLAFNREQKTFPIFLHAPRQDFELIQHYQFNVNQLGANYSLELNNYNMLGKSFQQLRNKINKAKKNGIVVNEILTQEIFENIKPQLETINKKWLKKKGGKNLNKLVIDFDTIELNSGAHRLYIATVGQDIQAYIIYTRTYGKTQGWFHNLSRKAPASSNGIMQLINQVAMEQFQCEKEAKFLHFGFTPLVEFIDSTSFNSSLAFTKVAKWLASKGGVVYPAASQRQYKMSWRPSIIQPEFIAFPKGKTIRTLWLLLLATNSI